MIRRVEIAVRLDHPVERVFAYLADPERWHEFAPAVALRRRIGKGPPVIGARWTAIDRIGPLKVHFIDELVEHEPNRRVVWSSSAPWNARTEYRCAPEQDGTLIHARYEGDVEGWLRLVGWVPGAVLARVLQQDFKRLHRLLLAQGVARVTEGVARF